MELFTEDPKEIFEQESLFVPDEEERMKIIEAVLFTLGTAVEASDLAKAIDCPVNMARKSARDLLKKYQERNGAVLIREMDGKFQMCTNPTYYDNLIKLVSKPKKQVLSPVVLETLSIIAYKAPTTKAEIEKIRGVSSDFAVNKLVEYGLVEESGRLDAPGRPALFVPTEEFYRRFGVDSQADLPVLGPEIESIIKDEVSSEVGEIVVEA